MKTRQKKGTNDTARKRAGGRPVLADADRRDTLVRVLCTEGEAAELQQAASAVAMPVSVWVRSVALERARANALEKAKHEVS
jgi:hypothetical protein